MLEVTVEITNFCPYNCDYCSSNAHENGKHLSFDKIKKFLKSLKGITRINISGGEPLAHPRFYDILMLCYSVTSDVRVYTNLIRHIMYNSDIIKEIQVEANVCIIGGRSAYIPKNADKVHLLKLVHQGRAINLSKTDIVTSHNFKQDCNHDCNKCRNILLQADEKIVESPCKKEYSLNS